MKFEIDLARTYPHPLEKVWRALVDQEALGAWLMDTDFVPEVGRAFRMWCEDGEGGTDLYLCKVLELEPQHRMVWSWVLAGRQGEGETYVEFRLREVPEGTHLTIRHSGDRDRDTIERFEGGWPHKLEQLDALLQRSTSAEQSEV